MLSSTLISLCHYPHHPSLERPVFPNWNSVPIKHQLPILPSPQPLATSIQASVVLSILQFFTVFFVTYHKSYNHSGPWVQNKKPKNTNDEMQLSVRSRNTASSHPVPIKTILTRPLTVLAFIWISLTDPVWRTQDAGIAIPKLAFQLLEERHSTPTMCYCLADRRLEPSVLTHHLETKLKNYI